MNLKNRLFVIFQLLPSPLFFPNSSILRLDLEVFIVADVAVLLAWSKALPAPEIAGFTEFLGSWPEFLGTFIVIAPVICKHLVLSAERAIVRRRAETLSACEITFLATSGFDFRVKSLIYSVALFQTRIRSLHHKVPQKALQTKQSILTNLAVFLAFLALSRFQILELTCWTTVIASFFLN